MDIGLLYWATDETLPPHEFAREAEQRGFESLFLGDHTHVPVEWNTERLPANAGAPDASSPPLLGASEYRRMLAPIVALTSAAMVTERIKLGTAVCLVAQRDPILLGKEIATLDQVSNGRVVFGVGFGWNAQEMAHHGVDHGRRHAIVREKVAALKALWTQEQAEFHGKHVQIEPSWSWPKPVQAPHPPILVGGDGPVAMRHAVEYGDGWIPVAGGVVDKMAALRAAAEQAGRDPATVEVTVTSPRPSLEGLLHYRDAGVRRVILWVPPPSRRDDVRKALDAWSGYIPAVRE